MLSTFHIVTCFNRTFMELKLAYAAMRILYKITK